MSDPHAARHVLLVHGLWMTGIETWILRQRLREHGFEPRQFTYASWAGDGDAAVRGLESAVRELESPVHLVGHSLGGVMILKLLESRTALPPGRVVLLGSPVRGSIAASSLARWPIGRSVLGPLATRELNERVHRSAPAGREVGVIAGSLAVGLGRAVADLPEPNDGTVAVAETVLPGATAELVLPVSHTSMLLSSAVAEQTAHFLEYGKFRARS